MFLYLPASNFIVYLIYSGANNAPINRLNIAGVVAIFLVWPLFESLLIWKFGSTFGKYLLGNQVIRKNGEKIKYSTSVARVFAVMLFGYGLWIPGLSFFTLLYSLTVIKRKESY
ncbi:hypothetical protein EHO60_03295 [Leptospira fletcheri]|uniref:RDD domain-containing protein n=1 Tax=Leptospira fletcheri TaxID=2484981 RepID=A0A4R9GIS7_9LEPT|nr:hypothetical protein EHO60_03295 [Leptospira fletcheri]